MKKFELCMDKSITIFGKKLFKIKAIISFSSVKAGEYGGYIEKEENLSQSGDAWVSGDAQVYGDARVSGNAQVYGNAWVSGNARVSGNADYIQISPIGSRDDTVTFFKSKENTIFVNVGCFFGNIEKFKEKIEETHGNNKNAKAYLLAAEIAHIRLTEEK